MTREQKIKYLRAIIAGEINPKDFTDRPVMNFTRLSPIVKDEISLEDESQNEEIQYNVDPDTKFICKEDGAEYTWEQIFSMHNESTPPLLFCSTTSGNEPFAVTGAYLFPRSAEATISNFLNNNKTNHNE